MKPETDSDFESQDLSELEKVDNRAFKKVKHTFEIQVKELKNIPILDKLIKDLQPSERSSKSKYI